MATASPAIAGRYRRGLGEPVLRVPVPLGQRCAGVRRLRHDVDRALAHAGASHNAALRAWLDEERFDLSVAGPYHDGVEGKAVEAALSALRPEFNGAPGDGPRFVPIGVPPEPSDRPAEPPLTLDRLGQITGGALLVYLALSDVLPDGRRKPDPARPSDTVVIANMEGVWDLGRTSMIGDVLRKSHLGS